MNFSQDAIFLPNVKCLLKIVVLKISEIGFDLLKCKIFAHDWDNGIKDM